LVIRVAFEVCEFVMFVSCARNCDLSSVVEE
jgi:hypothetical protein